MKSLNTLIIILLLSQLFFFSAFTQSHSSYITLLTQEDIDNFVNDYGDNSVVGNIQIGEPLQFSMNTSITNLDGLSHITKVLGSLTIRDCESLVNIDGLSNITSVGYPGLGLIDVPNIENLNGLSNIENVNGNLVISGCSSIENLEGLSSLNFVEDDVYIKSNFNLKSFEGLEGLNTFEGLLYVYSNTNLENLDALSHIEEVKGNIFIAYNPSLRSIDAFQDLEEINALTIEENDSLTSFNGFSKVRFVYDNLNISNNDLLQNLEGFKDVTVIYGTLRIKENQILEDISALENVAYIGKDLAIYQNNILSECCIVPNLEEVCSENFYVNNNGTFCNSLEEIEAYCLYGPPQNTEIVTNQSSINNDFESFNMDFFPNPTTDFLNVQIQSTAFENFTVSIFDINGKLLIKEQFKEHNGVSLKSVDVSHLAQGKYFVSLKNKEYSKSASFVKN